MPDPTDTPTAAGWTRGIARGDRAAFAAFYEVWFDRVVGMARPLVEGDLDRALDLVQDVMVKAVSSMPALRDDAAVALWMQKALCSAAIDRFRADAARRRREHEVAQARAAEFGPPADADAQRAEAAAVLRRRLDALPAADRRAVLARFADGRALADIGEELGITTHATHGRIRRALERLRRSTRWT